MRDQRRQRGGGGSGGGGDYLGSGMDLTGLLEAGVVVGQVQLGHQHAQLPRLAQLILRPRECCTHNTQKREAGTHAPLG